MATNEKVIELSNRVKSIKSSSNPETNHIIAGTDDIFDDSKRKKQSLINQETDTTLADHSSAINGLNNQNYVSVTATDQTTAATDVLPDTGAIDTIYRVGKWDGTQFDETCYSEYAWNGTNYIHLSTKPRIGEVFDISVYKAIGGELATYADLDEALNEGNNVPVQLRSYGMRVQFIDRSTNEYVQYRLKSKTWSVNTDDWAICDEGVYITNPEFVYVLTDKNNKLLLGIEKNGNIIFGIGIPKQIAEYINNIIEELSLDEYEDIVSFLGNLIEGDKTLQDLLNMKVDGEYITNPEFVSVWTDSENKILLAIKKDGSVFFGAGIPPQIAEVLESLYEQMSNKVDSVDGKSLIDESYANSIIYIDSPEFSYVLLDSEQKIMYGIKKDGDFMFGAGVPKQIINYVKEVFSDIENTIQEALATKVDKENGKGLVDTTLINNLNNGDKINAGILYFNPSTEILPKLRNLKRACYTNGTVQTPVLTFLHSSDHHAYDDNIIREKEFYTKYSSLINFMLDTGDFVGLQITEGLPESISQVPDMIRVIGNHDTMIRVGTPPNHHWELKGQLECYNTNLKDYIGNWDVVQPADAAENGYCYYYKDFTENNVRLICLDGEHWRGDDNNTDDIQLAWFQNVLATAKSAGLHVIVAVHRPPFRTNPIPGNTFDSIDMPNMLGVTALSGAVDAINAFKAEENGVTGNFICWLCGHMHQDCMGLGQTTDTQSQLVISINNSKIIVGDSELSRTVGEKSQDCFNIVGIDTYSKLIKLIRIGAQYDRHMRKRETFCYDYGTNTLVYCN